MSQGKQVSWASGRRENRPEKDLERWAGLSPEREVQGVSECEN